MFHFPFQRTCSSTSLEGCEQFPHSVQLLRMWGTIVYRVSIHLSPQFELLFSSARQGKERGTQTGCLFKQPSSLNGHHMFLLPLWGISCIFHLNVDCLFVFSESGNWCPSSFYANSLKLSCSLNWTFVRLYVPLSNWLHDKRYFLTLIMFSIFIYNCFCLTVKCRSYEKKVYFK